MFGASEAGEAGRDFLLARLAHKRDGLALDFTQTHVDRPFLSRQAQVSALHANYKPTPEWGFDFAVNQSRIAQTSQTETGYGGGVIADWDMPGPWRQQYFFVQVDERSNLNDLGFQDRNNFRYLEWETGFREDQLSEKSQVASRAWEFEVLHQSNGEDFPLRRDITLQLYSERCDGGNLFGFVRQRLPVYDDRISRGNGIVRFQGGPQLYLNRVLSRKDQGALAWALIAGVTPGRSSERLNYNLGIEPRLFLSDTMDVNFGLFATRANDFLLWRGEKNFGRFKTRRLDLVSNFNWFISERQELRIKLEAIALQAELDQALLLQSNGRLSASSVDISDFKLKNLGFQIRYRYQLAELSDLFLVYSRGGNAIADFYAMEDHEALVDTLSDSFSLRDSDQFLAKFAYRFDF